MSPNRALILCTALLYGCLTAPPAAAQDGFGQGWKSLSPDTRQHKREQYFSDLPEPQQQRLRESQRRFHSLSLDRKRALCERFLSQNGYVPPACRNILDR
jgi:hypothetical protein